MVRVLFIRKEKHRPVGASGFFLDRPREGHGGAGEKQVTGAALDRAQFPPASWSLKSPHAQN